VKFLIDECLTIDLVRDAQEAGYEAYHIVHLGKARWKDWSIVAYCREKDFTLVTNNACDFRTLYARECLHPGLVILLPNVKRERQSLLFRSVLQRLSQLLDLTNRVLEVDLVGENINMKMYSLSWNYSTDRTR
jgi:predicted nuclease of predicted toxin-antitoxin system